MVVSYNMSLAKLCNSTVCITKCCHRVFGATKFTNVARHLKYCSSEANDSSEKASQQLHGFLKAQMKLGQLSQSLTQDETAEHYNELKSSKKSTKTFAELLSQSTYLKAGDLTQSYVVGKIVQKVNDDLYIDYGGKFYCVCKVPHTDSEQADRYKEGAKVVVRVLDEEMAARFMGYDKDMTLLEADATLVRLHFSGKPIGSEVDIHSDSYSSSSSSSSSNSV